MPKQPPIIIKANGDRVRFDRSSLLTSLVRSGAPQELANSVTDKVSSDIVNGKTTTHDIYTTAYGLLKTMKYHPIAARYSLKKAIMELGPTGFPFEQFIGEILKRQGYDVKVGVIVEGHCVPHEVDVVATKDDTHVFVEAKFHNQPGIHTDVKVPLYIHSRFLDIQKNLTKNGDTHTTHVPWIVTNTHFTTSAIDYGTCMGMTLIGWRYPESGGIETMIEEAGLHPVTCLSSLTQKEKNLLLAKNIVLCRNLVETPSLLESVGLSTTKIGIVQKEAKLVCSL
ncbi:MAG: ATPase [Candidatus Magasanikbacteria bacterium CG10_big_fil_rev_8_21_14_0_10_42_10]|uniref:ATPase n=2 Tax=Candidatus Magasanikiibacteriota TaxID=1752731 RepID=A0A2H0TVJ5_9BACT|nr:MAG: ATPase [Candidatus Magasanikbacteria bacterium CG10_big_fil_rev_8_21_14_0_10_42_10]PIZ93804.1 MAG: ATPase [Candidatus Magasanikbacteria bacterium CG_4_10_14_0_2_um_filter_41_10]